MHGYKSSKKNKPVSLSPIKTCRILGLNYAVTSMAGAVKLIKEGIRHFSGKYICLSNVHTTVMGVENEAYMEILSEAALLLPDGAPIAFLERGEYPEAKRVAGPDLMEQLFISTSDGSLSHYFYGGRSETLKLLEKRLHEKYPGLIIKGMHSPPFREVFPWEDKEDVSRINEADPDIIWVGLGAPKQEKWMARHAGAFRGVMIGVGAGFDFHAGTVKRAPEKLQKMGLEWFYRILQDPKRLIKRYAVTNIKFLWFIIRDMRKE